MEQVWNVVIEVLSWVELRRLNEDSALSRVIEQLEVKDPVVVNEAKRLVFEVLKRRNTLDYIVNEALGPDQIDILDLGVRNSLRLYTYMIHYSGNSFQRSMKFIEHVRNILGPKKLRPVDEAIDLIPHQQLPWNTFTPPEKLAYRYFHPIWYIEYLRNYFNDQKVIEIISPIEIPQYIRVNTLKADENVLDPLFSLGFQLTKVPELNNTYQVLDSPMDIVNTSTYNEGKIILQDKASVLVGEVASPKSNDLVIDICAAPGVKTSHLAQLMGNKGRIISVDYDERRLDSWRKLIERMGVSNANPILADATKPDKLPNEMANIVVLDPPCTGTGTFNEHPSGKWRINKNSIQQMANLQRKLVANAAMHVEDNGSLIYSTCSITFEENEAVITDFLENDSSFILEEATPRIGNPGLKGLKEAQRLYPYSHKCQGFFIAKLTKID